jgi:transposase
LPRKRIAMRKIDEILRLKFAAGMANRKIARSCHLSHTTVNEYLDQFARSGKSWPLPEGEEFFVEEKPGAVIAVKRPLPDWKETHAELKQKGVTLQLLWREYRQEHADGYGYSQFCELYRGWKKKLFPSMRQTHKAGEKMFVDYAGQKAAYYEAAKGEMHEAPIFVAVLGASSYTYAEAQDSEGKQNWLMGHVRALEYFGGVPEQIIPDNAKVGVKSPCYYEPELNPDYLELARHYQTAVLPTRVRRPKDKAKVEVGVQVVERWILAVLRKQNFLSLGELNRAIKELLEVLNDKVMKHVGKSRHEIWDSLEKGCLKPLPEKRFEYGEWRKATVGIDYHLQYEKNSYSVPWTLIHQVVDMRVGEKVIEVFQRGKLVTEHLRSFGKNEALTKKEHMPEQHQAILEWTPERFLRWADKIGPQTRAMISQILSFREYPEQSYRKCLGILKLAERFGTDRLENACIRALRYRIYRYRSLKEILENGYDRLEPEKVKEEEAPAIAHDNIRGNVYFGQGEAK